MYLDQTLQKEFDLKKEKGGPRASLLPRIEPSQVPEKELGRVLSGIKPIRVMFPCFVFFSLFLDSEFVTC